MTGRQVRTRGRDPFGEKGFYLDEFRGRTLVVVVPGDVAERPTGVARLSAAATDLVANGARLLLVVGAAVTDCRAGALAGVLRAVGGRHPTHAIPVPGGRGARISISFLRRVWSVLRDSGFAAVCVAHGHGVLVDFAQRLAVRLRVPKLVLVDPEGGVENKAGLASFMDASMLEKLLRPGEAEKVGAGHRRPVLQAVREALRGGVESVNLCDPEGVERELFTYEGAGTLFTLEDYCRVERLRVDSFLEVERLLERGHREGYLRLRNAREIGEILMGGYGATIGSGHLAGVCALASEPYRIERAGEIVGLYTITRFKGEGVGSKLLARVIEDARRMGLRYVFARTRQDRARAFFERHGFCRAAQADVPREKWRTRPEGQQTEPTVYKLTL